MIYDKCVADDVDVKSKCAPGYTEENGLCFSKLQLDLIVKNHNENFPENKIDESLSRKEIIKSLIKHIKKNTKCNAEDIHCWLENDSMKRIKKSVLKAYKPKGPKNSRNWLSTVDIDKVLYQYENKYDDFKYLGTVPNDFIILSELEINKVNLNHLSKIASVINFDNHNQDGSHWVAFFADLNNKKVYYFDSYGDKPKEEVKQYIKKVLKHILQRNNISFDPDTLFKKPINVDIFKGFDIRYNKTRHQFKNSECGVYSINFILRLLNGESFDDINSTIIKDDEVHTCRGAYFI